MPNPIPDDLLFSLTIMSPDATLYNGKIKSLSAVNKKGPFDILAFHANFVSIVSGDIVLIESSGSKKTINIGQAILKSSENVVYIFLGLGTSAQYKSQNPLYGSAPGPSPIPPATPQSVSAAHK